MTNVLTKPLVFLVVGAFALIAFWPGFHAAGLPMDEGMVLVYPEMLLKGHLPYRDFETIYAPGDIGILAAAYATFGTNIFVERAVGLIYRLLIVLAIFGIARRWGASVAGGCAFVTAVLIAGTDLMATTWMSGVALGLCSLWTMANVDSRSRCFIAGVLGGIAVLGRCDFGPALIISALPLFFLMKRPEKKSLLAGAALTVVPWLWLVFAVGPAQLLHSLFLFPVFKLNPGRHLPISAAPRDTLVLFSFHLVASVVNLAAAIATLREQTNRLVGRLLLSAALFSLALTYYAVQRLDSAHAVDVALVSLGLLPMSIFVLLSRTTPFLPPWIKSGVAIVIVVAAMQLCVPAFTRPFYRALAGQFAFTSARLRSMPDSNSDTGIFVRRNGRAFPFRVAYVAQDAESMLAELERVSLPGQRLFVGPADLRLTSYSDTYIYHMLPQLRPATYFLEMNPASANAPNSRLARDVESADWLVLNRVWNFLDESNRSTLLGPDAPNEVVRQKFDLWAEIGPYLLFRNKRLRNAVMLPPS